MTTIITHCYLTAMTTTRQGRQLIATPASSARLDSPHNVRLDFSRFRLDLHHIPLPSPLSLLRSYFTMYMSSEGRGHGHGRDDDRGSDRADHPDKNHGRGSW